MTGGPQSSSGTWWDLQPGEDYTAWWNRVSGTNVYARGASASAYNPAIPATAADPGNPDFKWQTWVLDGDTHQWYYTVTEVDPQGYGTDKRVYYDPTNKNPQYQQNFQQQMNQVTQMIQGTQKGETEGGIGGLPILVGTALLMGGAPALAELGIGAGAAVGGAEAAGSGLLGTGLTASQLGAIGTLGSDAYTLANVAQTGQFDPTIALLSGAVGGAFSGLGPIASALAKQGVSQGLNLGIQAETGGAPPGPPKTTVTPSTGFTPNTSQQPMPPQNRQTQVLNKLIAAMNLGW